MLRNKGSMCLIVAENSLFKVNTKKFEIELGVNDVCSSLSFFDINQNVEFDVNIIIKDFKFSDNSVLLI